MDFRFVAYEPQTGERLYQLPRANSVKIGDTFGTRGTLELTYSAKALNAKELPTFLEVQAEVTFDAGHTWTPNGPSLIRLSGSHEDTDQAGMRTLQFVGREWILEKARVGNGELELIDGKRPFYRSSPGQIIRTLLLEAQDRGAAQGITLGGFTSDRDSAGNLWSKVATIYYSPGLPIASVLENLVDQGMCDYRMDGRTIHLYDPETEMGRDLTDRDNPVRVHGAVTEAPVKYSLEDLASSALLIGDEGFELEVNNPSAPNDYGRLEVTIEQGGVSDSGTARIMVDEALQRGSREIREITRSQSAAGAAFLPYRDYRVGDFVQVRDQGAWERYRVREVQLVRDGQEWTIHTIINDRLQELLLKLAKRTNGIVNGSKGSGGDGTRPTPPEKPGIEPAAPEGLVIDQQVYLDRQGIARGQIMAGWGEVTESTKGQNVEIGGYELWWRRNETQAVWTRVAVTDGAISVNHSPVVLTDTFGNAMEYQWRVRAIAEASTRPGPFSGIVTLTMTQDTEPPNTPSMPTVLTDLRIITVDIDGLDEFGESLPVDYNHHRIYFAAAEDMVGAEMVGTLSNPGSWNSGSMAPDVPVWVAVSAVDNVGNESPMTPAQSVTPQKLVDDDSIRDELTGIDDKINDAVDDLNQAIDNIVIDANGTTTYWMPTEPNETTDPKPKAGDLWFDTSAAGKNKLHRFDGASWVSAADKRIDTIDQAQADLEADVDRVRTSVDGKNAVTQSTSTPPSQYDGAVSDIWEVMSSMGSGGRSVSRWRWNGTVWVSNLIGDTVLGNVDAAKIGTGYLDADRIEAGSISADKLLIGGSRNLIPWSQVEAGRTVAPHFVPSGYADAHLSLAEGIPERGIPGHMIVTTGNSTPPGMQFALNLSPPSSEHERFSGTSGQMYQVKMRLYSPDGLTVRISNQTFRTLSGGFLAHNHSQSVTLGPEVQEVVAQFQMPPTGGAFNVRLSTDGPGVVGVVAPEATEMVGSTLIEDGAITTDKIAVGAITAESGIIGSLDAGTITVGEMNGGRIEAGTITADKVLVSTGGELVADPWFDNRGAAWGDASGGEWTYTAEAAYGTHPYGAKLVPSTASAYGPYLQGVASPRITGSPGSKYLCEAWIRRTEGDTSNYSSVHMRMYSYSDQNGGSAAANVRVTHIDMGDIPANTWVKISGTIEPDSDLQFHSPRLTWYTTNPSSASGAAEWHVGGVFVREQVGATLIEDGAITTDKILANAITAGKIAALAIEADHIAANAVTADKIRAGAIDSMLITGARIRTAASGRRTELDVEGLQSFDASGKVVLTTRTSDGSIDMQGYLRQTSKGITFEVGQNYSDSGPGIQWSDSNIYNFPPGVVYGGDNDHAGKTNTLIQGPGVSSGNSYLSLRERGDGFDLRTWKGTGSSRKDWRVQASLESNSMYVGSSNDTSHYVYFTSGAAGKADLRYNHPTNKGYAIVSLRDRYMRMAAYDSSTNVVSSLFGDHQSTELTAGTRNLTLRGKDVFLSPTADISLNPGGKFYAPGLRRVSSAEHMGRDGDVVLISSSRKYKLIEEPIEATVESFEDKLLSVDAKTWVDRSRAEMIADHQTAIANGEEPEEYPSGMGGLERIPGVVAEDMIDAGLDMFVQFEDGEPESVMYDRIGPALIPIIRRLRDRVDALETKLGETA